jgi:hypothetical protein
VVCEEEKSLARWDNPGIPHKGWTLVGYEDIREDSPNGEDFEYETCEMCHNERIRYVHILTHPKYNGDIRVGCKCACKMTEDYVTHPEHERQMRNRASRRRNFLKQEWCPNQNGNWVLRYKGRHITAIQRNGCYGCVYNKKWTWQYRGNRIFDLDTLKLAAFDAFDEE